MGKGGLLTVHFPANLVEYPFATSPGESLPSVKEAFNQSQVSSKAQCSPP